MKAAFTRWVVGRINQESMAVDSFLNVKEDDYTPRLDAAHLYLTEDAAQETIDSASEDNEVPVQVKISMEYTP